MIKQVDSVNRLTAEMIKRWIIDIQVFLEFDGINRFKFKRSISENIKLRIKGVNHDQ